MATGNAEQTGNSPAPASSKRDEFSAFLMLTAVVIPVLAVVIVGGYGFLVWMSQLVLGPPTS